MINRTTITINFDYKARQFADFYDLESDNFDIPTAKVSTTFDWIPKT